MKFRVIIHNAEEGGHWAEIQALPGCFTQADTWQELIKNIYEAIECHLLAMEEENGKILEDSNQAIGIAIETELNKTDKQIEEMRKQLLNKGIDEDIVNLIGTVPMRDIDYKKDIYLAISERYRLKSERNSR
jgi:predicted RNase H-like HicB family nuclease